MCSVALAFSREMGMGMMNRDVLQYRESYLSKLACEKLVCLKRRYIIQPPWVIFVEMVEAAIKLSVCTSYGAF